MIDCSNIRVLLIGTTHFPHDTDITPIPNINANIKALKESLTDPDILGIPESQIEISLNDDRYTVESKLYAITEATRDKKYTLIIYYAGHGMINTIDGGYYLLTHSSKINPLQIGSIFIDEFKKYIKRSLAKKKIIILDCCHSGKIIDKLGSMTSKLQSEINSFSGTYIMTSSSATDFSLFPSETPDAPTYFTGKLLEIINNGIPSENENFSVGEIFNEIYTDFRERNLPKPQQSNFEWGQNIIFSKNKGYQSQKPDELAWEKALLENKTWAYYDFKLEYPDSKHVEEAKQKIFELEDYRAWQNALRTNQIHAYDDYIDKFKDGKYISEAKTKLALIREDEYQSYRELKLWSEASNSNEQSKYDAYLAAFPNGKFVAEAENCIARLLETEAEEKKAIKLNLEKKYLEAERQYWNILIESDQVAEYEKYLISYPNGKFVQEARKKIIDLKNAEAAASVWNKLEKDSDIVQLEQFVKTYPDSPYNEKAKERIAALKLKNEDLLYWEKISSSVKVDSFKLYLHKYPDGLYTSAAKKKIEALTSAEKKEQQQDLTPSSPKKNRKFYYAAGIILLTLITAFIAIYLKPVDGKKYYRRALQSKDSLLWVSNMLTAANGNYSPAYYQLGNYYKRAPNKADSAIYWYAKSADDGNTEARFNLGMMYLRGDNGTHVDSSRALNLLKLSADSGHLLSQYTLGKLNQSGISNVFPKDYKEALRLFQLAAAKNMPQAQFELGKFYERGWGGLKQDSAMALSLYQKSAQQGFARAQLNLGIWYEKGMGGTEKNPQLSKSWYQKAAIQGEPQAQYNLGLKYESTDIDSAIVWYKLSADNDYGPALSKMGYITAYGKDGRIPDAASALSYYKRAAYKGNPTAAFNLGYMYEFGRAELRPNNDSATYWYRKAADRGNASAQYYLGGMYENGAGGLDKNPDMAVKLYMQAATSTNGSAEAQYYLAHLYERGQLGLSKSNTQALNYYKMSAQHGCAKAYQRLIDIYNKGQLGLQQNKYTARSLYQEARSKGFKSIHI